MIAAAATMLAGAPMIGFALSPLVTSDTAERLQRANQLGRRNAVEIVIYVLSTADALMGPLLFIGGGAVLLIVTARAGVED